MIIAITSLYANPIHVGHIALINHAKQLGNYLIVIVNNDKQVEIKGSFPFMNDVDRVAIVNSLKSVDETRLSIDNDGTVSKTLECIFKDYQSNDVITFKFAKGGDRRSNADMPQSELDICNAYNCQIVYGVGGYEKLNSSSELIANAKKFGLTNLQKGV